MTWSRRPSSSSSELLDPFWPDLFSPYRQLTPPCPPAPAGTTVAPYHISNQMSSPPCAPLRGDGEEEEKKEQGRVADKAVDEALGESKDLALDKYGNRHVDLHGDGKGETQPRGQSPILTLVPGDSVSVRRVGDTCPFLSKPRYLGRKGQRASKDMMSPFEKLRRNEEERGHEGCEQGKKRMEEWLAGVARGKASSRDRKEMQEE